MALDLPSLTFQPGAIPMWGTFGLLLGVILRFWLVNRKLDIESGGGIRDHYAKEVASLREQVIAMQAASDLRAGNAEARYNEAIEAADKRHAHCEQECQRLREVIMGLERQIMQIHKTSIKLFEPKSTLPEDVKEQMRSMEQPLLAAAKLIDQGDA